jgi:hypothetical protein
VLEPGSDIVGFVVDKTALWNVSSEYFGFSLPLIAPTAPHSSSIIRGWYNRPTNDVDWVPLQPKKGKKRLKLKQVKLSLCLIN